MTKTRALVLDTETTGFDPKVDRIIEIAAVDFHTGEVLLHTRLQPDKRVENSHIHGITDAMLVGMPRFRDIADGLALLLFDGTFEALIGHNIFYDRGMLQGEYKRLAEMHPNLPSYVESKYPTPICTKRTWDAHEPKRDLQGTFKRFVDRRGFDGAHGALADTIATMDVLRAQIIEFGLAETPWAMFDEKANLSWGPTDNVIIKDGVVIWDTKGKYRGVPCHSIDRGYWKWVLEKDFPPHVKELAEFIVYVLVDGDGASAQLHSWAYGKRF